MLTEARLGKDRTMENNRTIMLHTVDGQILCVGETVLKNIVLEAKASFDATAGMQADDDEVLPLALDGIGRIVRHFNWQVD